MLDTHSGPRLVQTNADPGESGFSGHRNFSVINSVQGVSFRESTIALLHNWEMHWNYPYPPSPLSAVLSILVQITVHPFLSQVRN